MSTHLHHQYHQPVERPPWWGVRLWAMVAEPRSITLIMCGVYTMLLGQFFANIFLPALDNVDTVPRSIVNVLLLVGGGLGLISTPRGWWQFERAAITAVLVAYSIHLYWNVLDLDADGMVEWQKAARITMLELLFVARWLRIRGARLDPTKP